MSYFASLLLWDCYTPVLMSYAIEVRKAPVRIEVKTGISDYSYSELLEGDLQPGQEVIIGQQSK